MFILQAEKNRLTVNERELITSGSVNIYPVRFTFSVDWEGLDRTATFRVGTESRSVRLNADGECVIPWEVLTADSEGRILSIGVYGTRGDNLVLPTIWASGGTVQPGASAGEEAAPPTPGLYDQIVAEFHEIAEETLKDAGNILSGAEVARNEAKTAAKQSADCASAAELSEKAARDTLAVVLAAARQSNESAVRAAASEEAAEEIKNDAIQAKEASEAAAERAKQDAESAALAAREALQYSNNAAESEKNAGLSEQAAKQFSQDANGVLEEIKQMAPVGTVELPSQDGTLTYSGEFQFPSWNHYDPKKLILGGVTFAADAGTYTATFTPRGNCTWPEGGAEVRNAAWKIGKATGIISVEPDSPALTLRNPVETISVSRAGNGAVSAVSGDPKIVKVDVNGTEITVTGVSSGHTDLTISVAETENHFAAGGTVDVDVMFSHVFGVMWDYSNSSTALQRLTVDNDPNGYVTNDITEEPTPAIGSGEGGSPFDAYSPWSGMEEYNILPDGSIIKSGGEGFSRTENDTVVYIPEFYYRVVDDSENSKRYWYVADGPFPGFEKHPGSGKYVSRYLAGENYAVKSGLAPLVDIMRAEARPGALAKGNGWRLYDFATYCAILILYLVEYSDWNSQEKIGYGCVWMNENTDSGHTDIMNYHTGTADSARDNGKDSVQFRYLENLWGNVQQFVDGYIAIGTSGYASTEPERYNDTSSEGYAYLGSRDVGGNQFIKALAFPEEAPWAFFPTKFIDRTSVFWIPDRANNSNQTQILHVGGGRSSARDAGLFAYTSEWDSRSADHGNGVRLIYDGAGNGGENENQVED